MPDSPVMSEYCESIAASVPRPSKLSCQSSVPPPDAYDGSEPLLTGCTGFTGATTLIAALPDAPRHAAITAPYPGATAVARPVELTCTAAVSVVDHVTGQLVIGRPLESVIAATSCVRWPMVSAIASGAMRTDMGTAAVPGRFDVSVAALLAPHAVIAAESASP